MKYFRNDGVISRIACPLCLAFLFTAIPVLSDPGGTGEKLLTNYEVIEVISGEAIDDLMANMPDMEKNTLLLLVKGKGIGTIDEVFRKTLITKLAGSEMRVSEKVPDGTSAGEQPAYEFNYQLVRLNLRYADINRSFGIGSKKVDRTAGIGVFAQLIDRSNGDIVWVGETRRDYEDTISYSMLGRVEDPEHDFTRPERKELRWSKLVEPVIVTGIVTGLIYLFFSNQSSND